MPSDVMSRAAEPSPELIRCHRGKDCCTDCKLALVADESVSVVHPWRLHEQEVPKAQNALKAPKAEKPIGCEIFVTVPAQVCMVQ